MYWDSLYAGTFSLIPDGWEDENIAPLHHVAAGATWGEVKAVEKPYWLESLLETHIEDQPDEGNEITDATPFRAADLRSVSTLRRSRTCDPMRTSRSTTQTSFVPSLYRLPRLDGCASTCSISLHWLSVRSVLYAML